MRMDSSSFLKIRMGIKTIECVKYLWNSMKSNEDYEKGIDYFIHLFIKREEYAIISPIDKIIEYAS